MVWRYVFFYDDVGSIGFINHDFRKRMEENDIACRVFNPIIPVLSVFINNRDHRKITVIDERWDLQGDITLQMSILTLPTRTDTGRIPVSA